LILDLVPNHTSDQHPWFIASRSSRDDPKRDWYIWQPGADGDPAEQLVVGNSAAAPGNTTPRRGSIIIMPSSPSSPT